MVIDYAPVISLPGVRILVYILAHALLLKW